jgi:hypothetical protein
MIDWFVSLVIFAFVPELIDPTITNETHMTKLKHRLEKTAQLSLIPISDIVVSPPPPLDLPKVTGKALAVSATSPELIKRIQELETPILDVILTGIVGHSNQLAAILTDGKKDYVVGVGGYVSNAFKVIEVSKDRVALVPLVGKSRVPIYVYLNEIKPLGTS